MSLALSDTEGRIEFEVRDDHGVCPATITPTRGAPSTVRVIRGGGIVLQARWDDREQFAQILGQLRVLEERASGETADYMQRNLRQVAQRLSEKSLAPAA